jgi:hypothetical protein
MLPLAAIYLADGYRPGTLTVMIHSVPQSRQAHVSLVGVLAVQWTRSVASQPGHGSV